uniref:Uncharacterized protein n=1 Tax=Spongospora subterranea TaxID=70186 RepID=A0A0H5QYG1_9EUKA|eukprot:CRZ06762.1 hypothetical protein [Spongospora subterranea]
MCGGLEMVVEVILCFRFSRNIHFPILHQLSNIRPQELKRPCFRHPLPRILPLHGLGYYVCNRHRRVPFVLLVCTLFVLFSEVRLKKSLGLEELQVNKSTIEEAVGGYRKTFYFTFNVIL